MEYICEYSANGNYCSDLLKNNNWKDLPEFVTSPYPMGKMHRWEQLHYKMEMYGAVYFSFSIFQYFICCYEVLTLKTEILIQTSAKYGYWWKMLIGFWFIITKSIWAESSLLMDSEQLSGVSQLWIRYKKPKSYCFRKVKLIFAF